MTAREPLSPRERLDLVVAGVRDLGSVALGLWGVWHQQTSGVIRWELLIVYTAILSVPGTLAIMSLVRGSGTTSPALPSASGASESPSPAQPQP